MRRAAEVVGVLAMAAAAALAAVTSCSGPALAQASLARQVAANGGGAVSSPSFVLQGTIGQAVVGASAGVTQSLGHGFWVRGGAAVLDVDDPPGPGRPNLPRTLALGPATPNPVRSSTRFRLALPSPARIRFGLFDLQGRPAGDLVERDLEAGWHDLVWAPPQSGAGRPGVLFASLEVDGRRVSVQRVVVTP